MIGLRRFPHRPRKTDTRDLWSYAFRQQHPRRDGVGCIIIVVAVVAGLLVAFTALSGFFVDVLWFREVDLSAVFWTVLRTKVLLGVAFGLAFFVLLFSNLWIVRRITPRFRALTPEQEIIERYRMQFEPYARWLLPLFALVIALFVGLGVTTQWQTFLLWRNGSGLSFGTPRSRCSTAIPPSTCSRCRG